MIEIGSKNISKLDLSNSNLTEFPMEILNLKNLRKLKINNNKISIIPREIEKLKNLELLDLSNNNITNFYSKICSLKKLKVLNLNNNKIKTIPKQIANLKSLKTLQLANNKLSTLPEQFTLLESLQKLNISKNPFLEFPIQILKIHSLKNLWLNNLELESFPLLKIPSHLTNLISLYCYGKIINKNNLDKDFTRLTKIKGNCLPELLLINKSYNISNIKTKVTNKTSLNQVKKNKIFISYSHSDIEWLRKIQTNLKVLKFNNHDFDLWDDTKIKTGDKWKIEIEKALNVAGIAILIVSTDFLASDFVRSNELPLILKNAEENGTKILPLIVRPCRFTKDKHLSIFQSVNDPNKALSTLSESDKEIQLLNLTEDVSNILLE